MNIWGWKSPLVLKPISFSHGRYTKKAIKEISKKLDQMGNERITWMLRGIFSFILVKSKAVSPYLINLD